MKVHRIGRGTEEETATIRGNQRRGRVGSREDNK